MVEHAHTTITDIALFLLYLGLVILGVFRGTARMMRHW